MKRGLSISLPDRVAKISIKGLLMTLLVLVALIALLVLTTMLFGQTADLGDSEIGWIVWLEVSLL